MYEVDLDLDGVRVIVDRPERDVVAESIIVPVHQGELFVVVVFVGLVRNVRPLVIFMFQCIEIDFRVQCFVRLFVADCFGPVIDVFHAGFQERIYFKGLVCRGLVAQFIVLATAA